MYFGELTDELRRLYDEYEKIFGYSPGGEMAVNYTAAFYDNYVDDLKKSIETKEGLVKVCKERRKKMYEN